MRLEHIENRLAALLESTRRRRRARKRSHHALRAKRTPTINKKKNQL